jgi:hypothetical protein
VSQYKEQRKEAERHALFVNVADTVVDHPDNEASIGWLNARGCKSRAYVNGRLEKRIEPPRTKASRIKK